MAKELAGLNSQIADLKIDIRQKLLDHHIFSSKKDFEKYVPPFLHFVEKDKYAVHKMGKLMERTVHPDSESLTLFDQLNGFKAF